MKRFFEWVSDHITIIIFSISFLMLYYAIWLGFNLEIGDNGDNIHIIVNFKSLAKQLGF